MIHWTIKSLRKATDEQVLIRLINERLNKLTNPYTPMAERLKKISGKLDNPPLPDLLKAAIALLESMDKSNAPQWHPTYVVDLRQAIGKATRQ